MNYSQEQIEAAVKAKGYDWFENGDYDVNIVGVRNTSVGSKVTDLFDDKITISFKVDGKWKYYEWDNTTDPGMKSVVEYQNLNGVARLVPNQYKGSHFIGLHQGKYKALCQKNKVTVFRDKNKDGIYDEKATETGVFGINIHRSNAVTESAIVSNWSAGCQVFKKAKDFADFMKICEKASEIHGNSFTYTLILSSDIK